MSTFAGMEDVAPPSVAEASSPAAASVGLPSVADLAAVASEGVADHQPPAPEDVGLGVGGSAAAQAELPPDPEVAFG